MAVLGVDHYSLIWGLVGALLAAYQAERMGRIRSVLFVTLSTLFGAASGTAALSTFDSSSRPLLILFCLVAGFGAQTFITALVRVALLRIERLGGQ